MLGDSEQGSAKVDYDPRSLNVLETMRVGELQVWMDRVLRDCDQESACKLLYHYDLQRKRLDIIQATPPSRRTAVSVPEQTWSSWVKRLDEAEEKLTQRLRVMYFPDYEKEK